MGPPAAARPPRILWLTANFAPQLGGLQTYIDGLAAALGAVADVTLITDASQAPPGPRPYRHRTVTELRATTTRRVAERVLRRIERIVVEEHPDVIHLSNAGMAAFATALNRYAPVVASVHGNDLTSPWQAWPDDIRPALVGGLETCRRIFVLSDHVATLTRAALPQAVIVKTPAGFDAGAFYPEAVPRSALSTEFGLPADAPTIATCARIAPRKGHVVVHRALLRLERPVNWIIVGAASGLARARMEWWRRAAPRRLRIRRVERISDARLRLALNLSDVMVMTPVERLSAKGLDSEGFGLAYLEANACGRPVIGSDLPGCRTAIIDGTTGILVPPGDAPALAAAIGRLLDDPASCRQLGAQGRARALELRGWQAAAEIVAAHYAELTALPQRSELSSA